MKRNNSLAHLSLNHLALRNKFALLVEHNRQVLVVLEEMRPILVRQREEIAQLKDALRNVIDDYSYVATGPDSVEIARALLEHAPPPPGQKSGDEASGD